MITIEVRVFAFLRQILKPGLTENPREPFRVSVPPDTNLQDLLKVLLTKEEGPMIALVNGLREPMEYQLKHDDRVGLFPPIGGG